MMKHMETKTRINDKLSAPKKREVKTVSLVYSWGGGGEPVYRAFADRNDAVRFISEEKEARIPCGLEKWHTEWDDAGRCTYYGIMPIEFVP